jgi:hypothetical protein
MNRFIVEIGLCAMVLAGMHADAMPLGIRTLMHGRAAVRQAEKSTLIVTFDANGGSGEMKPETVYLGKLYILPKCGFTAPAGMEFDGWDIGKPGDYITLGEDIKLTAQWKLPVAYTVTFKYGDSVLSKQTVSEGKKTTKPAPCFRSPCRCRFIQHILIGSTGIVDVRSISPNINIIKTAKPTPCFRCPSRS